MHEPLLSRAAKPAPAIVLGMLLKPYSLGHELCLIRADNPISSSNGCSFKQLDDAVLICSQSWTENNRMPFDPLFGFKMWLWRTRLRFSRTPVNYLIELAHFISYRTAGTLEFPTSQISKPSNGPIPRLPGTPFLLRVQQWLMLTLNLSEADAWDYPYGLAVMRWSCYWESEGSMDIYNAHEAEFDAFVAEQEAKGKEQLCPP